MKKLLIIFAAAAALVACNKAETSGPSVPDPSRPVQFSVENFYSLSTKAEAVPIANGKQVGVYAGAPINENNVAFNVSMEDAATTGTLAPAVTNSLLWAVGQTDQATKFLAVYPYESERPLLGTDESDKYIEYAITDAASVAYANIFLTASASQAPGTGTEPAKVALAFKHPFAKLVYNIDNQSDDFVSAVKVSGVRQTGHVLFADGTAVPTGDAIAADAAVALAENGTNSFMTVVMPEATAVNPLITVEMVSGAKYTYVLSAAVALAAGKVYSASITITGSHGTSASDRTVLGTFSVTDWENVDTSVTGTGSTPAASWWYLVGNIDDVTGTTDGNWSKYIPFKCIGIDLWQVDFYYAGPDGFKLMYAATLPDWTNVWGMSGDNLWTINAADVKAEDAGNDYLVHHLTKDGGNNIVINAPGKFRIKFHPSENQFYIYTLD